MKREGYNSSLVARRLCAHLQDAERFWAGRSHCPRCSISGAKPVLVQLARCEVASLLTIRAYVARARRLPLYFFEVNTGSQTLGFAPAHYVEITQVRETKKAALFAHKSQRGEDIYRQHHEVMENFRGREVRIAGAEAFVLLPSARGGEKLPGT